ncbi:MAG: glycosyltransferase family 2 protein [Candidatus Aminicenantes bacterium]|nr:glycosyltransferase family 2 protein [Candidatus Aminicenantes bacterium]
MPSANPRVSVVVPNFNYARFLDRRVQSILVQTFSDFELILLDDASTDGSLSVIETYAADSRVRIHINETNSGSPFAQWNRGVDMAHGDFVWIAEADDFAEAEFLEHLVSILESDPRLGLVYCQSRVVDENGTEIANAPPFLERLWPGRWQRSFRNSGRDEVACYLVHRCTIPNASAVLFRRRAFLDAGAADESMRLCGDWMTYVRLLLRWDLCFSARALNATRCHSQTVRSTMSGNPREIEERYRVLETVLNGVDVSMKDRFRARQSRMYLWVDLAEKKGWGLSDPRMERIRKVASRVDPCWRTRFFAKRLLYRRPRLRDQLQ